MSHRNAAVRVADELREQINNGVYPPGARLPSYRTLAAHHGVAVNTIKEAVRLLARENRVRVRERVGVEIRDAEATQGPRDRLREMQSELAALRDRLNDSSAAAGELERRIADVVDELGDSDER